MALPFLIQEVRGPPWLGDVTCSDGTRSMAMGDRSQSPGGSSAFAMESGNSLRATLREQGIIRFFADRIH